MAQTAPTVTYTYDTNVDTNGEPSTFEITLAADGALGSRGTVFDGFCGDVNLPILGDRQQGTYTGGYIDLTAAGFANAGAVNWLLNAYPQSLPNFPANAVQAAIWSLLGQEWTHSAGFDGYAMANADEVNQLVGQALQHRAFMPAAGESMAILIDPLVNSEHSQPVLVEVKAASLGDRAWHDLDADGVQDAGEQGIANVTVELVRDIDGDGQFTGNEILATTTTNANGSYLFNGLTPGLDYQIRFDSPDGYEAVSPRQADADTGSGANSDGLVSDVVVLAPGEYNPSVDAGFYNYASLGDRVWDDNNANGVQDVGETGKAGVKVELYTCVNGKKGALVASTVTDDSGNYNFSTLKPGDYMVKFISTDGSVLSTANVGADDFDSDVNNAGKTNGFTGCYNLDSGEHETSVDAGFYKTSALGDKVWNDTNANGVQDSGEAGKADVTVELYACVNGQPGALLDTRTTDADGRYRFTKLMPGDYMVKFIANDGSVLTTANVGKDKFDSDAGANGFTGCYTLEGGKNNMTVDAGFVPAPPALASLGDKVWSDTNANGVQDAGESGRANVTVELYACVNGIPSVLLGTEMTDANGNYKFTDLQPGDYTVRFVAPDGTVLSTANVGADDLDSDANGVTGFTGCYTLAPGENNTTVDAGVYETASLGDKVWNDTNANGVQDAGESGRANVAVELYTCVNGQPGALVGTQLTDANGNYNFSDLKPGDYTVRFVAPDGAVLSTANVGADDLDSDADGVTGFTGCYTLASGENNTTVDAGVYETASLGDKVWNDTNANGVQDAGESGRANVAVELYTCVNGQPGALVGTQFTDANGNYSFSDLTPGDYTVKFVAPDGTVLTTANVGADDLDSDANASTGFTGCYTLSSGENETTVDAGVKPLETQPAPDQATVCEDRSTSFNVLANDAGVGLTLIGVAHETSALDSTFRSKGGAISFTADGAVTYKSMTNYYGNDKLVYTLQDAQGKQFTQTVDVKIAAVSDAPTATAAGNYHPGGWENTYVANGVTHWVHGLRLSDFGTFSDKADALQSFGTYNNGVQDDVDMLDTIRVFGLHSNWWGNTQNYAEVVYRGEVLDFSTEGQYYDIPVADINAGYLDIDFHQAWTHYSLAYKMIDSGDVENEHCYPGSVISNETDFLLSTPIALDLNGDGQIGVTGATSSAQKDAGAELGHTVQFDIDADGQLDTIEWFDGSGDGILVDNRDGQAATSMDGSRLFGADGGTFADGYDKLASWDQNGDGQVAGDELAGLTLWVDDGDAIVQDGELQSLAAHAIVALSTQVTVTVDDESRGHLQSTATRADGSQVLSEDVYFAHDVPGAQDLLSSDGAELDALIGAGLPDTAATVADMADMGDAIDVGHAAELLRQISLASEVAVA